MAFSQKNRIKVAKLINSRTPFNHASMSGKWVSEGDFYPGRLNAHPETVTLMKELLKDRDLYVVYSYATPIAYAWDRTLHTPAHYYSATTSHHQSITRLTEHYATAY